MQPEIQLNGMFNSVNTDFPVKVVWYLISLLMHLSEKGREVLLKDKLLDEEALEAQKRSELSLEQRLGSLEQGLDNLTTR